MLQFPFNSLWDTNLSPAIGIRIVAISTTSFLINMQIALNLILALQYELSQAVCSWNERGVRRRLITYIGAKLLSQFIVIRQRIRNAVRITGRASICRLCNAPICNDITYLKGSYTLVLLYLCSLRSFFKGNKKSRLWNMQHACVFESLLRSFHALNMSADFMQFCVGDVTLEANASPYVLVCSMNFTEVPTCGMEVTLATLNFSLSSLAI